MLDFSITELKDRIKNIDSLTEQDERVLSIIDSFWGCGANQTKAQLAGEISKYAGCEAWKIAMHYTYTEH